MLSGMPESTTVEMTFVFADIAGFTALTEAHGDHDAAALVADFCSSVRAELPASGGTEVKTIGDAVMLTIPDPAAAIRLGLRIAHELMRGHGAPAVRVGLHHGPAIERDGDYFGAAVNLAARVSGEASGGEVLLTASTAARAPELPGVLYEPRGRRALRNVREPVELFAAVRADESAGHVTPARPCVPDGRRSRALGRPPHVRGHGLTSSARSPAPASSRGTPSASHASRASDAAGRS